MLLLEAHDEWIIVPEDTSMTEANSGAVRRVVTQEEAELSRLRRENAELRMERDILKSQPPTLPESRCEVRADQRLAVRVPAARAVSPTLGLCERLSCVAAKIAVQACARQCAAEVGGAGGFCVSLGTIKRVRRELGLRCVQRKRRFRVATTDSSHQLPVAPNLLGQDFTVQRPDEVWTADITYVATQEGWLYVAAIKDLFAGEIVGRSFGERMTTDLVVRALEQAVRARRPAKGLIHHSDRGSQYCSHAY